MASIIEIANIALTGLGSEQISSLSEDTKEAILVNAHWNQVRRSLLRRNTWNFAIKRTSLARSTSTPEFGFTYKFALPIDCIRVLEVYTETNYKLENQFILTDNTDCYIKYISDITDTNQWTSDFTDLVAVKLQYEIAYGLTRDKEVQKQYFAIYEKKLAEALFADASEDISDPIPTDIHGLVGVRY